MEKMKTKIKKNDQVKIIAGKDKGKTGKVLKVDRINYRVVVQGINMVKKSVKPKKQGEQGGIVDVESPIHISNVSLITKNGKITRVGYKVEGGQKIRISRKTGEEL